MAVIADERFRPHSSVRGLGAARLHSLSRMLGPRYCNAGSGRAPASSDERNGDKSITRGARAGYRNATSAIMPLEPPSQSL